MSGKQVPGVGGVCLAVAVVVGCACQVAGAAAKPDARAALSAEAITRPSEDVTPPFVRAGRIAKVHVEEGDAVKAGQLLMELDNAAEKVQVEQLKAQAEDETRVQAAEAQWEQKKVELKRFRVAKLPPLEIDRAVLAVKIARLSVQLAKFEHAQSKLRHVEAQKQLGRMRLLSPIDGRVEKITVSAGEAAEALRPVIRVVKTDPLRIDVPVPVQAARKLDVGAAAEVGLPGPKAPARGKTKPEVTCVWKTGKVTHIGEVADAASDTLTVRVELPNPPDPKTGKRRPAGEHVTVRFPSTKARNK